MIILSLSSATSFAFLGFLRLLLFSLSNAEFSIVNQSVIVLIVALQEIVDEMGKLVVTDGAVGLGAFVV
jgi:hypothetical protein